MSSNALRARFSQFSGPSLPLRLKVYLGLFAGLGLAYAFSPSLPSHYYLRSLAEVAAGLAMLYGVRRNRPKNRLPWLLFALGLFAAAFGDLSYGLTTRLGHQPHFPAPADYGYLLGYGLAVVGILRLVLRRGTRLGTAALVDALLVSGAGLLYLWLFLIEPALHGAGRHYGHAVNAAVYPICDALLLVLLVRVVFGVLRNTSQRLLMLGVLILLVSDSSIHLVELHTAQAAPTWLIVGLVLSCACWGLAALHPDMAERFEAAAEGADLSWLRLGAIGLALLSVPGAYILQQLVYGQVRTWATSLPVAALAALTLVRVCLFVQDVKRQRHALSDSERRFRSLIEHSHDGITILDREGRLVYESPSVWRMRGYEPGEQPGVSAFHNIHPDDLPLARELFPKLLAGEEIKELPIRVRRKDGSWLSLEITAYNLLDDPAIAGLVVNSHDVTRRQALEGELRQSQKMEAVGRLAGGIAHDFNNLLTAVSGYAEMAALKIEPEAEAAEDLAEVQAASKRAAALVSRLLAFSRQQETSTEIVFIRDLVDDLLNMLQRIIGEDITIRTDYPTEPIPVAIDPVQVEQIVVNLAVNARDAMPQGGAIDIELRHDLIDFGRGPQSALVLGFSDEGCGMDEETVSHIFEPFYTTKDVGKGSGLGLSTVYGIVEQLGGRISVESTVGVGTRFLVAFPALAGAEPAPSPDGSLELSTSA